MSFLAHAGLIVASNAIAWVIVCAVLYVFRRRPVPPRDLYGPGDVIVARVLITVPKAATRADVSDWLNLMVAGIGSMRSDNALHDCEVEAHALAWGDAEC